MKRQLLLATVFSFGIIASCGAVTANSNDAPATPTAPPDYFKTPDSKTTGSVTVNGKKIDYDAFAGTIIVRPEGYDDADPSANSGGDKSDDESGAAKKDESAKAVMFYAAYFKKGAPSADRPITFIYNGGPGSATVWLHMGAFGPKRVVTKDDSHTPAAPYQVVNNDSSLLDASDLVFVDAPGAGFSRITGKDSKKSFYGVDEDGHAFAEFIQKFLTKYGRWNSPKYLFGESYGTTRSAVVSNMLENEYSIDLNGIILLSQILNFDLSVDGPTINPGVDLAYETALPTYAATALYHKKLPAGAPDDVEKLVKEVEHFAMTDYALALQQGAALPEAKRNEIAEKLHQYTGLPVAYIKKANLRIDGGEFEKSLQADNDLTTGRLDTRFSGPMIDPLSQRSSYDPQSSAISSAYVAAFNNYVRKDMHYGMNETYKLFADGSFENWNFKHQQPNMPEAFPGPTNVMPDLAFAMKTNPDLKVMLNAGYYDLATPFFEGIYEMNHLPIPPTLQKNISYAFYDSGHMVYAHQASLKEIHDNVTAFIQKTDNIGKS